MSSSSSSSLSVKRIDITTFAADVLVEIFQRLSVKQLCQLKTLSKQWLVIISSPHFKKLFNERSIRSPRLLITDTSTEGHPFGKYEGPLSQTLHISTMDISTGVICREFSRHAPILCHSFQTVCSLFFSLDKGCPSLCNPMTHERYPLPWRKYPSYGFHLGHLVDTNEYKIVHVFGIGKTHEVDAKVRFEILTLKDGGPSPSSWKIIENYMSTWSYKVESASIKSSIYWLVYSRDFKEKRIISIELKTERFTTISYPEVSPAPDCTNGDHEQLVEIKGHLCLAHFSKKHSTVSMFILKDHENHTWVKEWSINLLNMDRWIKIVGYLPHDNNDGEIIFHWKYGKLLSYNVKDRCFTRLGQARPLIGCYVSLYFDTFFSLEGKEKKTVQGKKEDGSSSHTEKEKEKEDVE